VGKCITDFSSVTTVGLDLAKHVFQVHGADAAGRVIVARALRHRPRKTAFYLVDSAGVRTDSNAMGAPVPRSGRTLKRSIF